MIKVSIIVPVYNVADYIERCWDSIKKQTYENIEVVFIDDCGNDDSISRLLHLIERDGAIHCRVVHHDCNRGISAARNYGYNVSKGDYVYFLDSDDDIRPDCIESLVAPLSEHKYDIVVGDYNLVGEGTPSPLSLPAGAIRTNEEILKAYADGKWYVMPWNKLYRRGFLEETGMRFKERMIHEDVLWTFITACKAQSLYVVKKPLYNYYVRSSSIMTSMSIEKDLGIYLDVFDEIVKFVKAEGREKGVHEYKLIEGKKCGIMYSLLQKGQLDLYRRSYPRFRNHVYISPLNAWSAGMIGFGYLIRDLHYCMPEPLGRLYKRLFYCVCYKWRGKKIDGAVWK